MSTPTHKQLLARWKRDSARRAVRRAIRAGRIAVPATCSRCHLAGPLQAHHHSGYSGPSVLDVEFLCRPCHDDVHRGTPPVSPELLLAIRARERWPAAFSWIDRVMDGEPSGLGPELPAADQRAVDALSGRP